MRLYAKLTDVGTEYCTLAPTIISLKPFKGCYFIDIPEKSKLKNVVTYEGESTIWKKYDGIHKISCFYNERLKEIDYNEEYEDSVEGVLCQKYENGVPIGESYFKPY